MNFWNFWNFWSAVAIALGFSEFFVKFQIVILRNNDFEFCIDVFKHLQRFLQGGDHTDLNQITTVEEHIDVMCRQL